MRSNQLIGYGFVVGLQGTGQRRRACSFYSAKREDFADPFGRQHGRSPVLTSKQRPAQARTDIKNVAAVMVPARLPGFAQARIKKLTSTCLPSARPATLRGGPLLLSSLRGVDGEIYAFRREGALNGHGHFDPAAAGSEVAVGCAYCRPRAWRSHCRAHSWTILFTKPSASYRARRASDSTTTNAIVNAIDGRFGADVARALDRVYHHLAKPHKI
jgi:flagellar P-ring protein precursor FlgI